LTIQEKNVKGAILHFWIAKSTELLLGRHSSHELNHREAIYDY
jgi:hypothetical protein